MQSEKYCVFMIKVHIKGLFLYKIGLMYKSMTSDVTEDKHSMSKLYKNIQNFNCNVT